MTVETDQLGLWARPIYDAADVEILRQIRNACRDGFSHDNGEISQDDQRAWWARLSGAGCIKAWLYYARGEVVGFGVLRKEIDGRWYSSVGVLPEAGGHGYGRAITIDLIRQSDETVYASARLDNPQAMRLHREADWEETSRDDRLAYFQTKPHVHLGDAQHEWARFGWVVS